MQHRNAVCMSCIRHHCDICTAYQQLQHAGDCREFKAPTSWVTLSHVHANDTMQRKTWTTKELFIFILLRRLYYTPVCLFVCFVLLVCLTIISAKVLKRKSSLTVKMEEYLVAYSSIARPGGTNSNSYMSFISARCNIYISHLCYDVSVRLSVRLSVTFVHCGHRVQWIPDTLACLDRWMSLLILTTPHPDRQMG